jgi:MYXO-CTERM domain-containing protein
MDPAVHPLADEVCDGKDNDCDGTIDNGLPLGGPCTPTYDTTQYPGDRSKGQCKPGVLQCDPQGSGGTVCVGGVGPSPEICDGKDNDCDGEVDESGTAPDGIDGSTNPLDPTQKIGDPCGVNVGECKQGTLECVNGKFLCTNGVPPSPEQCDCLDNDCDGVVDNEPTGDAGGQNLCSPGKTCVAVQAGNCQCAGPCGTGEFPCPTGKQCKNVPKSGTQTTGNYCVSDDCGDCSVKSNPAEGCGPSSDVPNCVCKGNKCVHPCDGVVCPNGQQCAAKGPAAGTCQPAGNCFFHGCKTGEVCNNGVCQDDPCDPNTCAEGEVCKPNATFDAPRCVGSCAGVTCPAGEQCVEGACEPTGCGQDCPADQYCQPDGDGGGTCGPSKCITEAGLPCSNGAICDPVTGQCGNDPCEGVVCPTAQACVAGECQWAPEGGTGGAAGAGGSGGGSGGSDPDAGAGASSGSGGSGPKPTTEPERGVWGLATGGGGCSCKTAGSQRGGAEGLLLMLAAVGLLSSRRRRRRPGQAAGGAR